MKQVKVAKGKALTYLAASHCFLRHERCDRRWYTMWLYLHDESDAHLRARMLQVFLAEDVRDYAVAIKADTRFK